MARPRRMSPQTRAVLLALAERPGAWRHGYELCTELGLKAGTVYPILIRLADRGDLETAWEPDPPRGRPARHLYRLSESGTALAADATAEPVADPRPRAERRMKPGIAT